MTDQTATNSTGASQGTTDQIKAGVAPMAAKARQFAKDRPYAAAAVAGVVGLAILNTLRGR